MNGSTTVTSTDRVRTPPDHRSRNTGNCRSRSLVCGWGERDSIVRRVVADVEVRVEPLHTVAMLKTSPSASLSFASSCVAAILIGHADLREGSVVCATERGSTHPRSGTNSTSTQ